MNKTDTTIWIEGDAINNKITNCPMTVNRDSIHITKKTMNAARLMPTDKVSFGYEDARTIILKYSPKGINIANFTGNGDGSFALTRLRHMLAQYGYTLKTGPATAECNSETRTIKIKIKTED